MNLRSFVTSALTVVLLASAVPAAAQAPARAVIDLWTKNTPAFGVFVPNENPTPRQRGVPPPPAIYTKEGGDKLGANPLYDFAFLNMEGNFDPAGITAIVEGLKGRKMLLVRIPTPEDAGLEAVRGYIRQAFELGADGVTVPHIRSVEEAKTVLGYFRETKQDIWSPQNPKGTKLAMLMIEDPGALAQAKEIADLPGYSILACGIGSLTAALKGDRAAAEAGNQKILAETKRVKLVNMLTANPQDVSQRVKEGFLALLGQGAQGDEMIRVGRVAANR